MRHTSSLLSLLVAFAAPAVGLAESGEAPVGKVAPVVVTATRTPQPLTRSLAAVTLITRDDITRSGVNSLPDLLRQRAGLDVVQQGGLGRASSLFMRGANSDQTLFLLDGVRMGSATVGSTPLELVPLSQVERIEIVRGPRSSLFGSEAIGGVVQIFTKQPDKPFQAEASAGAGSFQTRQVSSRVGGFQGDTFWQVGASHQGTKGFNARQPVPGPFGVDQPDADGYEDQSASLLVGHRFKRGDLAFSLFRTQGDYEYDGSYDHSDFVQQSLSLKGSLKPTDSWKLTLQGGQFRDQLGSHGPLVSSSRAATLRNSLNLQSDYTLLPGQTLTLGGEWRGEEVSSDTAFTSKDRENQALFLQHLAEWDRFELQAGGRFDKSDAFGDHSTWNLAGGYWLPYDFKATVGWGTGFKAPSFNQLYWPDTGFGGGNPALQPETSQSWEVGLSREVASWSWSLRGFDTRVNNLIDGWPPSNVSRARMKGVEVEVGGKLAAWEGRAEMTFLSAENRTTGKDLARRAGRLGSLHLAHPAGAGRVSLDLKQRGSSFDEAANTTRIAGYGTLDLHGEYPIGEGWVLKGTVGNLFDKAYQTVATYNSPGRYLFLEAEWRM
ncbi:MAG: TonB-dependent receptor [Magnetococcales bacterium]|nr:TonB-dependent receptor [Magnetococcales bacterium]